MRWALSEHGYDIRWRAHTRQNWYKGGVITYWRDGAEPRIDTEISDYETNPSRNLFLLHDINCNNSEVVI